MTQLVALHLFVEDFGGQEPFTSLASATSLQQLDLTVGAIGDPSPLSALTGLSSLKISSFQVEDDDETPFNLSSLQPLSTMQQLEVLDLGAAAFTATSLQGLAGLSNLKNLDIFPCGGDGGTLRSLEGISPSVTQLLIGYAPELTSLVGMEGCTGLEELILKNSNIHSLQPLRGLSSLKQVMLSDGRLTSLEGLKSMSLQSLSLLKCSSLIHLSGIEHLSALKSLAVEHCGVTSLQPLSQLGEGLQKLRVSSCTNLQEEVLELPHVQPTANVVVRDSNIKEVVLAGGLRRAV
jgi:Leucine-rich repeat (LRR) protein